MTQEQLGEHCSAHTLQVSAARQRTMRARTLAWALAILRTDARPRPLDGKVAAVTGGSRGLGRAIVDELLKQGCATVIACARDPTPLSEIENVVAVAADVRTSEGRLAFVDEIAKTGGLDILVNNVGTNLRGATADLDEGDYRTVLETNLDAAVFLCRDCRDMLAERRGCVVNIGSISGVCSDHTGVAYAVSKAGLDHLTRYLACEWGPAQIRVNSVDPWFIRTELTEPLLDDAEFRRAVEARTPLRRVGEPADVSGAVAYLCAAPYVTGQVLCVDGGLTCNGFEYQVPHKAPAESEKDIAGGMGGF